MTRPVKIYEETLGRGNGKGNGLEETLSVLSSRNIKKASEVKAGVGGKGGREH